MPARDPSKPTISGIWLLVVLIVGILIVGDLTRRMTDARRIERDARMLGTEVAVLEAEHERLQEGFEGAGGEAQVEAWARGEARMVREGERLVLPIPASESEQPAQAVADPAIEPPTPWEVWWALLTGG